MNTDKNYPIMNIRIDATTKQAFKEHCENIGTTPSAEIKRFISESLPMIAPPPTPEAYSFLD